MNKIVLFLVLAAFAFSSAAKQVVSQIPLKVGGCYRVTSVGELYGLEDIVKWVHSLDKLDEHCVFLDADIVVNEDVLNSDGTLKKDTSEYLLWNPIQLAGYIDGRGHTISGLVFYDDTASYVGVFSSSYGISNLNVEDSYFRGRGFVGGLSGNDYRSIQNCHVKASINAKYRVGGIAGSGKSISNSSFEGIVSASEANVGGIVGHLQNGSVVNNTFKGNVSGDSSVGGIVGYAWKTYVDRNYTKGRVEGNVDVGGIIGEGSYYGYFANNHNSASVKGKVRVGGVAGFANSPLAFCSNNKAVEGEKYVGGIAGSVGYVTSSSNTGAVKGDSAVGGIAGASSRAMSSYNGGTVTGEMKVGGISGVSSAGISGNLNVGPVSGTENVGALVGFATSKKYLSSYSYALEGVAESEIGDRDTTLGGFKTSAELSDGTVLSLLLQHPGYASWVQGDKNPEIEALAEANQYKDERRDEYYEIENAGQLYHFSNLVAYGGLDTDDLMVLLMKDIVLHKDLLESDCLKDSVLCEEWVPIGHRKAAFEGVFDGRGHTVSGLFFRDTTSTGDSVAFISTAKARSRIQNIGIEDSYLEGRNIVGGLVAYNRGSVKNCHFNGTVRGRNTLGGLIGHSLGQVLNSYHSGTVDGEGSTGGLVGINSGLVSKSYNEGYVNGDGGVVGQNYYGGTVSFCCNLAKVNGGSGVVGVNGDKKAYTDYGGLVIGNYNMGAVSGKGGSVIGTNYGKAKYYANFALNGTASAGVVNPDSTIGDNVIYKPNASFVNGVVADSLNKLSHYLVWTQGEERPVVRELAEPKKEDGTFLISDIDEFMWFSDYVNQGFSDKNTKAALVNDIVFNENLLEQKCSLPSTSCRYYIVDPIGFGPIPSYGIKTGSELDDYEFYRGEFDGRGHTLSGIMMTTADTLGYYGLFAMLADGSRVKNLHIRDSYFYGGMAVGAIAGASAGFIDRCSFEGHVGGRLKLTGALVGNNSGAVFGSYAVESINGASNLYSHNLYYPTFVEGFNFSLSKANKTAEIYKEEGYLDSINKGYEDVVWKQGEDFLTLAIDEPKIKNGAYQISNLGQLAWFMNYTATNKDITGELTFDPVFNKDVSKSKCYKDREVCDEFRSDFHFTTLKGNFDGKGHTISGLYGILANEINAYGSLKNLKIKDSYVVDDDSVKSKYSHTSASFVVTNRGTIQNVVVGENTLVRADYASGIAVTNYGLMEGCEFAGTIVADSVAGGIAAINDKTIRGGKVSGDISGIKDVGGIAGRSIGSIVNSEFTGTVEGSLNVGGIAGFASTTIDSCYSAGIVKSDNEVAGGIVGVAGDRKTSLDISTCANASVVRAPRVVGGIVGEPEKARIRDCYNVGSIIAKGMAAGLMGNSQSWDTLYVLSHCYNYYGMELSDSSTLLLPFRQDTKIDHLYAPVSETRKLSWTNGMAGTEVRHATFDEFEDGTILELLEDGRGEESPWKQGKKYPIFGDRELEPVKVPDELLPEDDWHPVVATRKAPVFGVNVLSRNIQVFNAPAGSEFALMDMMGRMVARGNVPAGNFQIHAPHAGSYLLKVGSYSQQVNVK